MASSARPPLRPGARFARCPSHAARGGRPCSARARLRSGRIRAPSDPSSGCACACSPGWAARRSRARSARVASRLSAFRLRCSQVCPSSRPASSSFLWLTGTWRCAWCASAFSERAARDAWQRSGGCMPQPRASPKTTRTHGPSRHHTAVGRLIAWVDHALARHRRRSRHPTATRSGAERAKDAPRRRRDQTPRARRRRSG
mmetsp:Transcript_6850/g.21622  ORF Transcript_6850/g.21622 Transcript_6850/m.21622 type:complete len:201 (-) Transcript_6850:568-1170(-)